MDRMNNYLLTICIPTYNAEKYIEQTLNSLYQQTYKKFRLLIIDNASNDKTGEIVESFRHKFQDFTFIRNSENIGAERNFNKCFEIAVTEFVAVYHADDVYDKQIVKKSLDLFMSDKEIGAVSVIGNIVDKNLKSIDFLNRKIPEKYKNGNKKVKYNELFRDILIYGNSFLFCPTLMIRKDIIKEIGGFDFKLFGSSADLGLWLKISDYSSLGIVGERLFKYRIHDQQGSSDLIRNKIVPEDIVRVVRFFYNNKKDFDYNDEYLFFVNKEIIKCLIRRIINTRFSFCKKLVKISFSNFLKIHRKMSIKVFMLNSLIILIYLDIVFSVNFFSVKLKKILRF